MAVTPQSPACVPCRYVRRAANKPKPRKSGGIATSPYVRYSPQLDGLRALAILMVFAHHALRIPLLWSGVDLFFILSGYLITSILLRDSERMSFREMLSRFYLRRAERLLPAYVVCLLLIAVLVPVPWHRVWPFYAFFLQNVPYAFGIIGDNPLVPLWSLAVEQHFYLVWPLLVFFLPRRWLAPCMLAVLFGVPVLRAVCTPLFSHSEPIYCLTPFRIDTMAAGALAALWLPRSKPQTTIRAAQLAMAVGIIAYIVLGIHPWFRRPLNNVAFNSLAYSLNILVLGGLFVWVWSLETGLLYRLFTSAPMRGLGRISYMFYLLHLLVLQQVSRHFGPLTTIPVTFAITAAAATLSWFALERPILSLSSGHQRLARPPVAT